jgi:CDP-diacylglycerol pyrophosphatase
MNSGKARFAALDEDNEHASPAAPGWRPRGASALAGAVLCAAVANPAPAAQSSDLWRVIHGLCATDRRLTRLPAPCIAVDLKRGTAVLRQPFDPMHLLLAPTRRITGIESEALLAPDAPNYWQAAWEARRFLDRRAGYAIPREDIGLAVNSVSGRSQNQLHIHVTCVRADIRDALAADAAAITRHWQDWDGAPGRRYRVRRLRGEDLGPHDPFKLLARDPAAAGSMEMQTLVVVGARLPGGAPGFYLLADRADPDRSDPGHGEELLDHRCRVLKGARPPAAETAP